MYDSQYFSAATQQGETIHLSANETLFENNLRSLPSDPLAPYRAPYMAAPEQFNNEQVSEILPQPVQNVITPPVPDLRPQTIPQEPPAAATDHTVYDRPVQRPADRSLDNATAPGNEKNDPPRFAIVAAELLVLAACVRLGLRKPPVPGSPSIADGAMKVFKSATDKLMSRVGNSRVGSMFASSSKETAVPTAKELAEGALSRKIVGPPDVYIRTPREQDPFNKYRIAN
jgi:hypothetical protein